MGDTFTCRACHQIYQTKSELEEHKTLVHRKKHQCPACSRGFYLESKLKRHFRSVHSQDRPYVCDKCKKGFARKDKLNDHLRSHNKAMNFSCNLCESVFVMRSHLNNHLRTIHSVKILRTSTPDIPTLKNLSPISSLQDNTGHTDFNNTSNYGNLINASMMNQSSLINQDLKLILSSSGLQSNYNSSSFCDNNSPNNIWNSLPLQSSNNTDVFKDLTQISNNNMNNNKKMKTSREFIDKKRIESDLRSIAQFTSQDSQTNSMYNGQQATHTQNQQQQQLQQRYYQSTNMNNLGSIWSDLPQETQTSNSSNWLNSLCYLANNAISQQQQQQHSNQTRSALPTGPPQFPGLDAYIPSNRSTDNIQASNSHNNSYSDPGNTSNENQFQMMHQHVDNFNAIQQQMEDKENSMPFQNSKINCQLKGFGSGLFYDQENQFPSHTRTGAPFIKIDDSCMISHL